MQINDSDLRILILYALVSAGTGISPDAICLVVSSAGIGYLNVREAFEKLRDEGLLNVLEDEGKSYTSVTPEGKLIVTELQGTLSITLRKGIAAAMALEMARMRKELSMTASYEEAPESGDGFNVLLGLSDRGKKLFSLSVMAPTAVQADIMVKNFKADPGSFYTQLISMLTSKATDSE